MRRAFLAMALAIAAPAAAEPFDPARWIADFEQLKEAITRRSPNLEWAAERGMDLPAVERRARARLAAVASDAAARDALTRFVRGFAEGHMELSWPSPASSAPPTSSVGSTRRSTCADLGYRGDPDEYAIATRLSGYEPVGQQDDQVRAGTVPVAGRTVGVLRIPLFAPSEAICATVLKERGMSADAPCDDACADAVSRRADDLFLSEIADRVRLLAAAGADQLLLDVATNGGGNDPSIAVARMIGGMDVPTPSVSFARTAARLKDLEEDEAAIRAGPARPSAADRAVIARLLPAFADARAQAATPCDLSPLWRGQPAGCSNLIRGPFYAGGLAPVGLPGVTRTGEWGEQLSSTARFTYPPVRWNKPVMVLVDGNSASSTELLAAMLQDAGRAVIIGSPTHGSGCGWTMPKQDVVLGNSGGVLTLPDCARLRRDGRNEIDGIEPDVLIGFRQYDTARQRGARLVARLPAAIEVATKRVR